MTWAITPIDRKKIFNKLYRVVSHAKWRIIIANIGKVFTKYVDSYFKRSRLTPRQGFCILMNEWMFLIFSNFLLWAVYPSMVIHHEQCIFIIYGSAGRKKTVINNKSKEFWFKKIHFHNLISLNYTYKESHPPANKWMAKVISDYTKRVKLETNLAPCSTWNYCWM